jgi:pentatricopeptide repeat protein
LDKALQLAEAIKARGLRCDELVYNTLMDGCVKANDVTAGVGLFEEMVHAGMRPSAITHSILARLYQRAGYEEDATEAVAQLYMHHGIERPVGGDRGKGAGRRGQRSPGGRSEPNSSPIGSPSAMGYGARHQRSDSCWSAWSDTASSCAFDPFTDPLASGASTPLGSPMASQQTGAFLPFDAMRCMPPPLPGMGGADTPLSCRGATPTSGAFHGSPIGSPCALPYGEIQQQGQVVGMPVTPGSMPTQAMPSLPPWPFTQQPQPGSYGCAWAAEPSQPGFPQPGPPADMAFSGQPQQGQVFFESFFTPTPTNQQVVGMQMNGGNGQNPFCM